MSAVADGVGRAVCALTRARRGEAAEPPTLSIADGTALRCGRVGSRHFQKPLRFVLGASLFYPRHMSPCLSFLSGRSGAIKMKIHQTAVSEANTLLGGFYKNKPTKKRRCKIWESVNE